MDNIKKIEPAQSSVSMIPKHRFDCINLCLKETKQRLAEAIAESESMKKIIAELEYSLLNAIVEKTLAQHKARNLTAVKALIDFSKLKLGQDGIVPELEIEILRIKKSQNYLFESQEDAVYVLMPIKSGDSLNKSIANYIKRTEK